MAGAQLLQRRGLQLRRCAPRATACSASGPAGRAAGGGAGQGWRASPRVAALALRVRQLAAAQLLELGARERPARAAPPRPGAAPRQVLAARLQRRAARVHADRGLQALEGVAQLGARALARAAHQHVAGELAGDGAPARALLVAPVQVEPHDHRLAARALRQQLGAHAVGERTALEPRLDIARRGIEGFAGDLRLAALVAGERRLQVGRRRNLRALRRRRRHELPEHAVGGLEVGLGDALHVGRRTARRRSRYRKYRRQSPSAWNSASAMTSCRASSRAFSISLTSFTRARSTSSSRTGSARTPSSVASSAWRAASSPPSFGSVAPKTT
jgi:hypothetical protein